MGSVTLSVEADVSCRTDSNLAAGAGPHLPVGYWSGAAYRSAMRFPKPAWGAWVSITKATLSFYISDHAHVGVRNSSIYVRRQTEAGLWTKSAGTQDCNSGFSAANTTQEDDIQPTSTDATSFSSGTTANAKKSVTVTNLVRYYFDNDTSKIVLVFSPVDTDDYTELWADEKSGYNAELVIEYTDATPPLAPTPVYPPAETDINETRPTFSWVHNATEGNPQTGADVEVTGPGGPWTLHPATPAETTADLPGGVDLTRAVEYSWKVRTYDVTGAGPYSAVGAQTFSVKALPVVTISATRKMVFANGAPRLVVEWSSSQPQTGYQVTAPGYDSGYIPGAATSHVLSTLALVNGTPVTVTVGVAAAPGSGFASQAFTPRYGLTTHRCDLTAAPLNWGSPVIVSTVPTDCSLVIEYGSDVAAIAAPSAWFSALSSVPKKRYLFWRAWFIPSASAGPTLDSITIPVDATVTVVDKWGTTRDTAGLAVPWSVDPGEAVYGTRSMTVDADGTARKVYSYGIKVRQGRSYILTGLMKSQGDSGAHFRLEDPAGAILEGGGLTVPPGPVQSDVLSATKDWYDATSRDTHRYKTPVWVAPADMTVYVVLAAGGAAGAKAWWDAVKLEESTVATPWSPGAIGAVVLDAGGVQVDGSRGGVLRYKGTVGGARDIVEGGANGLVFGGDAEVYSPTAGQLLVPTLEGFGSYGTRANRQIHGGGTIKLDSSAYLGWSDRFIVIAAGTGSEGAADGYFSIYQPTSGTVLGVMGASNKTATAAGVPLSTWEALYVVLPKGGSQALGVADLRVASYPGAGTLPSNWVLVAARNEDGGGTVWIPSRGKMLTHGGPASLKWDDGPSFPANPTTGTRFFRTDLGMEFFWHSSGRWLSTELFSTQVELHNPATFPPYTISVTTAAVKRVSVPFHTGWSDIWLDTWRTVFFISAGTALSGSHSWTIQLYKLISSAATTLIQSTVINSGSRDAYRKIEVPLNVLLNAGTEFFTLQENMVKVGTPGTWHHWSTIDYRVVAT